MMKRIILGLVIVALLVPAMPTYSQGESCGDGPPSRLFGEVYASVVQGIAVPVSSNAGGDSVTEMHADVGALQIYQEPQCIGNTWWWQVHDSMGQFFNQWAPETVDGEYVLEPFRYVPSSPVPLGIPMTQPIISQFDVPLPVVQLAGAPQNIAFVPWDWLGYAGDDIPDPLILDLPDAYAGNLPVPPINLDEVAYASAYNLSPAQLTLLAQNGFVVVPGNLSQFEDAYRGDMGKFVTTDALLHSLYLAYQSMLMQLEVNVFYGRVTAFVASSYRAAETQLAEAAGTELETPARNAAVYYAVVLTLLADGEEYFLLGYEQESGFKDDALIPSAVLAQADPAILALAQPYVEMINAAQDRLDVSFLEGYKEDFSQYKPRSYYAGDPLLESYFRAMMWMGRITFRAKSEAETLTGLMVMRAFIMAPDAYPNWAGVAETLTFMIGPMDDLSLAEYLPLSEEVFGDGLPLDALGDPAKLAAFLVGVKALPGPHVNSIKLPVGVQAEDVTELTQGFRLFGQRFTLDGYIMQQLIFPEVGTQQDPRTLPLGLDVAAAIGSDVAYTLADEAGATEYANYTENLSDLRSEINAMDGEAWLENLYGGWLWALQPLLVRDPALIPPLMQTDAWQRKDLHTFLGNWTEIKHASLLYAKQPTGGRGGGGDPYYPPLASYNYVEPNPQVFARIAVVAATLDNGLSARGYYAGSYSALHATRSALHGVASLSARLAEIARQEVAGEPISDDDQYWLQEQFSAALYRIRSHIQEELPEPPPSVALAADVANNPDIGTALEEAIGLVDYIYVVTDSPYGLQLTKGGVYSYYEFVQPIDERLTDEEWRTMMESDDMPSRPTWIDLYFSQE